MKTVVDLFTDEVKDLIKEHNVNSRLNLFLYKDEEANKLFAKLIGNGDRFNLVNRVNQIEKELIPFAISLHDTKVKVKYRDFEYSGVIEHFATREFEGRTHDNNVAFRREFEDDTYSAPETIALWINTGDKYSTHLYTANNIILVEDTE